MSEPSMLEIALRVAEMRGRYWNDPHVAEMLDAVDRWFDEWDAFRALPWYRQAWEQLRGRLPRYESPFRTELGS